MSDPRQVAEVNARGRRPWRQWPWGALALGLAVLAWAALALGLLLFLASFRPPGDGSNGVQAVQNLLLAAVALLVLASLGSGAASVLGWRLRRGRVAAAVAAVLVGLLMLVVAVPMLLPAGAAVAADDGNGRQGASGAVISGDNHVTRRVTSVATLL